jgi:glycosyltransferase involved in cell wall biosynthesis
MKILPISVVIASVGGKQLFRTLDSILNSEFVPIEVVVSLPPKVKICKIKTDLTAIKIINSDVKGQVKQRIFGYQFCTSEFILQSDDDIYYSPLCLKKMFDALNSMGKGIVVGPILMDYSSQNVITIFQSGFRGFLKNIFDSCICLAPWGIKKMGKISKIGLGYGVDVNLIDKETPFEVSWLPGGCSMSHRSDVILEDYYPYSGKAFGEDILQSLKRKKLGLKMYILPWCKGYLTDMANCKLDSKSMISNIRAHRLILEKIDGNIIFFYIWALFFYIKTIIFRHL